MSDVGVILNMLTDAVLGQVENATSETVKQVAFGIEGQTKINIQQNGQIDTGFMLNSVYTIFKDGNNMGGTWGDGAYKNRAGHLVPRRKASAARLPYDIQAAVVVGANYAVYQELKQSFLYRAAQEMGAVTGSIVRQVFKTFGF